MTNSLEDDLSEASSRDHASDGDRWWPMLTSSLQRPQAMESTTLTALLLLLIVATTDRETALPTTGRVVNLVCELQQNHDGPQSDAKLRASVISRLSEALACLRGTLN
jgi:hypothetical protein